MKKQDLQKKLFESANINGDENDLLPSPDAFGASSAVADIDALSPSSFSSAKLAKKITCSLAGILNSETFKGVKCQCAFDGGLELSCFGAWGLLPSGALLVDVLSPLLEKIKADGLSCPVVLDKYSFWLLPSGSRQGFGCFSYTLVFEEDGRVKYRFYLHKSPSKAIPAVRVKAEYEAFRKSTLQDVENEIFSILSVFGLNVDRYTLSRIDFNVTVNRDMTDINNAVNESRVVNKCHEYALGGGKSFFNSFRVGNITNIQLAIYNKSKELMKKYDADKVDDLSFVLDDNVDCTRYEFRLGRNYLRSIEIDTIKDFIDNQIAIVNYLTLYWFHVRELKYQHGKTLDVKLSSFWDLVRCALLYWSATGQSKICKDTVSNSAINKHYRTLSDLPCIKRKYYKSLGKSVNRLFKIAVGCLVSAFLCTGENVSSVTSADLNNSIGSVVYRLQDDIYDCYKKRLNKIESFNRDTSIFYIDSSINGGGQC